MIHLHTVLAEMDDLKKTSDLARNTIRWLEREFTNGSRFIRLQRNNESKPLSLIKIPRKLGEYRRFLPSSGIVHIDFLNTYEHIRIHRP